jgi:DNA-directed RNA polymerase subunit RPC12/RpoP
MNYKTIKLHCMVCKKDWTTLSERDKAKKFAIHHLQLDKMRCPHCGASNYHLLPKPKKSSTRRGYAGSDRYNPTGEFRQPNIIVHPECQPHVSGNPLNPDGLTCHCNKNCKSYFNCWTGNVDDGEYVAPLEKSLEQRQEEAKEHLAKMQRDEENAKLLRLRTILGKIGFCYDFNRGLYAHFGNTNWKLSTDDAEAIIKLTWNTPQTRLIKRTFESRKANPILAKALLMWEYYMKRRA